MRQFAEHFCVAGNEDPYGPQFASMENMSDFCEDTGVGRVIGSRENWSAEKNLKQLLK